MILNCASNIRYFILTKLRNDLLSNVSLIFYEEDKYKITNYILFYL